VLFVEYRFIAFFAVVFCVHWALRRHQHQKIWLLLCSYAFYAAWDWRFLALIWLSTLVDHAVGLKLADSQGARRKHWMWLSLVTNLGLLGVFKYFDFFTSSGSQLLGWLGLPVSASTLEIVLPVGISFYTFQTLSYSIDIYRGTLRPARTLSDLALYVGFFPQLVAGPIVRAASFLPQLDVQPRITKVAFRSALLLFLMGFFKKAVVSEQVAGAVDWYFEAPGSFTSLSAWIAAVLFAVQIYCDFSGYSDMAIASARLLGYELCPNFDAPYFARNVSEFWSRWHISLSSWLRDYLYIPLGGNRCPRWLNYRNLLLTMLLGGLWHGAAWTFVIWGLLHGIALVVHREWTSRVAPASAPGRLAYWSGPLLTFAWVCLAWIFFRAPNLEVGLNVARSALLFDSSGTVQLPLKWLAVAGMLGVLLAALRPRGWLATQAWRPSMPSWCFAAGYGVAVVALLTFAPEQPVPFIYFQF
jgi:alginate O-acetyltransferase complex protein AlgI